MKTERKQEDFRIQNVKRIKRSRFPMSLFAIYLGVVLLMAGVHTGILVVAIKAHWNLIAQILFPIIYWGIVAGGLTLFTRKKVRETYEKPMLNFADAAGKVAAGDFSVRISPIHSGAQKDYLDVMIDDFNKMAEELGSIETLKTDFISNVSHEMKTPIAVIKNYAELLKKEKISDEKRCEYTQIIENTAEKLSNLVGNILKLNKLENQCIVPEVEKYDLCRQLCGCILQFEDIWEEKGIEVEAEIEERIMIEADESLLELVWNNVLSNAIKFTEPGGQITIRQTTDGMFACVEISDTGCGMSKECVRHIFDKFYQGDSSHSGEGNGLGLAMVHRVLELLGGKIEVESVLGKGSTFRILIPIPAPAAQGKKRDTDNKKGQKSAMF